MRIATYNIEWFSHLFDDSDVLQADDQPSRRHKTTRATQAKSIAHVLNAMDADLVMIIEAPNTGHTRSTTRALEGFARTYGLRQTRAITGFANGTEQEIAALYDPDVITCHHDPKGTAYDADAQEKAPRFDTKFYLDTDVDDQPDMHRFSKPPLELQITHPRRLRLIGVHNKSKAPHGARSEKDATRRSLANRRKQLAQAVWLRRRIDDHLDSGDDVVVLGDLNDGPGLDAYETLFGRSSVEVIVGSTEDPARQLFDPHASVQINPRQGWTLSTARFYNGDLRQFVSALLDYVLVSKNLRPKARWQIWHPFDVPRYYRDQKLRDALLDASDHYPVTVDLADE